MTDFSYLNKLQVSHDKTAEFKFYQLEGEPRFIVVAATDTNKPFTNAVLKRSGRNLRRVRNGHMTGTMISESRDDDRELYPQYIIQGWTGVMDAKGKTVKYSKEVCRELLGKLPDYLFDELRDFCGTPGNFLPDAEVIETEEIAKN